MPGVVGRRKSLPPLNQPPEGFDEITSRQRQILDLYCTFPSSTYKQIADDLGLHRQTVRNHMHDALRRTGTGHIGNACFAYGQWLLRNRLVEASRPEDV